MTLSNRLIEGGQTETPPGVKEARRAVLSERSREEEEEQGGEEEERGGAEDDRVDTQRLDGIRNISCRRRVSIPMMRLRGEKGRKLLLPAAGKSLTNGMSEGRRR